MTTRTVHDQKPHNQQKEQQNSNNLDNKMERKTTIWIFQATNKQNLTREDLDIAKKGKH